MLDVAIGLVLMFAISALMVTSIQELWNSWRNTRGNNLFKAISSMLGDDSGLAQTLLDQPLLKSLYQTQDIRGAARKPSYVSSDAFVGALLDYLSRQHAGGLRPGTPLDLVTRMQQAGTHRQLTEGMSTLLQGAEQDWDSYQARLRAWFDAVNERSIGWFKRDNQIHLLAFGLLLAVGLNINPIVIGQALWEDAELRGRVVKQAELALQIYQAESGQATSPQSTSAQTVQVAPAASSVEQALAELISRLGPAANQLEEAKKLTLAEAALAAQQGARELRAALGVERQTALLKPRPQEAYDNVEASKRRLEELQAHLLKLERGNGVPTGDKIQEAGKQLAGAIDNERRDREAPMRKSTPAPQDCNKQADEQQRRLCRELQRLDPMRRIDVPLGWPGGLPKALRQVGSDCEIDKGASNVSAAASSPTPACEPAAETPATERWSALGTMLAGWMITAFAATLGAPFWFDMLSKLMKLRGSGSNPDTTTAPSTGKSASMLTSGTSAPASGDATVAPASSDALNDAEHALTDTEIEAIQRRVLLSGAQLSRRLDIATRDAIKVWQIKTYGQGDGVLSRQQIQVLLSQDFESDADGYVG